MSSLYGASSSSRSGTKDNFEVASSSGGAGRRSSSVSSADEKSQPLLTFNVNDYVFSFEDVLDEEETKTCFVEYLRNDLTSESLSMMAHRMDSNHDDDDEDICSTGSGGTTSLNTKGKVSLSQSSYGESKYHTLPSNYYYCLEKIGWMKIKKSNTNKLKFATEIYNDYINDGNWKNQDTLLDVPHSIREKSIQIFSRLVNDDNEYVCPRRVSLSSTPKDVTKLATSLIEASRSRNNSNVSTSSVPSQALESSRKRGDSNATAIDVSTSDRGRTSIDEGDLFVGDLICEDNDIPSINVCTHISNVDSISVDEFFRDYFNVFNEIEACVTYTLKELCFPLFLKCDRFQRFLELKQKEESIEQLLDKVATLKPVTHQNFIAFIQNLNVTSITVEHFSLLKYYLWNEEFWSRIKKGKNYEVFTSTENYRMESTEDSKINFFKYEILFPFNCKKVMKCLLDTENRKLYDKLLKSSEQLDRILKTDTTLACEFTQEVYRMKWPAKDRVFMYCASSIYDSSSDTYFLCVKSVNHPKEKPIKDSIKGLSLVGWAFKHIDENTCKYYQLIGIDFKGKIPVKVIHQLMKFRANNYAKDVLEFLKKSEKNGWKQNGVNTPFELMIENGPINLSI